MSQSVRQPALLALLALFAVGCSDSVNLPPPFVFDRPGEVVQVCFDTTDGLADEKNPSTDEKVVLPFECCMPSGCPLEGIKPVAHALVTQIEKGEVAAVDLESAKVLDSERRIPGFTFVDVGGLPSAIVTPKRMPPEPVVPPVADEPVEQPEPKGPLWTYVAGRDLNSIRAIPTCRFLLGRPCGPELVASDEGEDPLDQSVIRADFRAQTELFLPEAPGDMVLDPSENALWITLPSLGMIARVTLGTSKDRLVLAGSTQETVAPFSFTSDTTLAEPVYFKLDDDISLEPGPLETEETTYAAACGLGYTYDEPTPSLMLLRAPFAESTRKAEPSRMRLLAPGFAGDEPLLLVADPGQAVLHAFTFSGELLVKRGVQAVGARLRDFAVTPKVPAVAPPASALSDDAFAYAGEPTDPVLANLKQYLYGIDERGGVMVFDMTLQDGAFPQLKPLLAPVPRRDSINMQSNYADRLLTNDAETAARALDVVDTRYVDPAHGTADYCGGESQAELDEKLKDAQAAVRDADKALDKAKKTRDEAAIDSAEKQLQDAEKTLGAVEKQAAVPTNAGPKALRGVFVVVVASDGKVTPIDVHDLDMQCRARTSCAGDNLETLTDDSGSAALMVRRHAARLEFFEPANVSVTGGDELERYPTDEWCPAGYRLAETGENVCTPRDPWRTRNGTWSVTFEGPIFDIGQATLAVESVEDGSSQLVLRAPTGFDLCKRGVLGQTDEGAQFQIAIGSEPDQESVEVGGRLVECPLPTIDSAQRYWVSEAYTDRLVLQRPDVSEGRTNLSDAEVLACYPSFVGVRVMLNDAYLVLNNNYLHRTSADEDGRCVVKERDPVTGEAPAGFVDEHFNSRAWINKQFVDPSIAFTLTPPADVEPDDLNPEINLSLQATLLRRTNVNASSGRTDALPRRVRYFPETGELFIVDQASQGLKRFTLSPEFDYDTSTFR